MKTDRELLEMAAKAAGFDSFDWLAADNRMNVYTPEGQQSSWNPITDDGDALRLAVKLGLTVAIDNNKGMAIWREHIYAWMKRNAGSAVDFYQVPPHKIMEVGGQYEI